MADPIVPSVSTRVPAAFPPRWAFFKGLLTGAEIEVTALAAALTAAGVGRLAAQASSDKIGGRRLAMFVAARAHAVAGAGLVLIAAIPHGHLPNRGAIWLWIPIVGLAVGALCGAVIGVVCGGAAPVKITDVMALAIKRPTDALRSLLDPEDLLKLGAAVRQRTTQVLGGIFEPAERPPEDKEEKR